MPAATDTANAHRCSQPRSRGRSATDCSSSAVVTQPRVRMGAVGRDGGNPRIPLRFFVTSARPERPGGATGPAYSARVAGGDLLYAMYERRLRRQLAGQPVPRHVVVMCDGNRRWARAAGESDVSLGHQAGADKIE